MPLLAHHPDHGTVVATVPQQFARVHRVSPSLLTCRECGWTLYAVRSHLAQPFFRHAPHAPVCSTAFETLHHLQLKQIVADAIDGAGWTAQLEQPIGTRRADVRAVPPDPSRTPLALEVQLSRQRAADTLERTDDYRRHGHDTIWIVADSGALGRPIPHGVPYITTDVSGSVAGPATRRLPLSQLLAAICRHELTWQPTNRRWHPQPEPPQPPPRPDPTPAPARNQPTSPQADGLHPRWQPLLAALTAAGHTWTGRPFADGWCITTNDDLNLYLDCDPRHPAYQDAPIGVAFSIVHRHPDAYRPHAHAHVSRWQAPPGPAHPSRTQPSLGL
ncbi:hypothetical protein [Nitriliruptor alkaliphilus]|uniref:competence protein CoiA family protein n=1 Tax=Nitriliruptor alkaliphilus TaxID=427918 RepID=UPI0006975113|nr:hypothetical protein [Nitriliruptor alkaliphilus]